MDFFLFLLVNAALFLRPQDLFESVQTIPFYNILIVTNLIVASPAIMKELGQGLEKLPGTACVLGIWIAIVASLLARSNLEGAWLYGVEFMKVVAYFILMTSILTTKERLGWFVATFIILTVAVSAISIADFNGYRDFPIIKHAREGVTDKVTGIRSDIFRLTAYGVFGDPNDLSMMTVVCMILCLGGLLMKGLESLRIPLLAAFLFLGYALLLTQSRGGLLALIAGIGAMLLARYGASQSTLAIAGVVPVVLTVFGGRQASFGEAISSGTGGARTELWYSGLQWMKWAPIFGLGHGEFAKEHGLVAHSSYVQALAEWGIIGGTMFLGLFFVVCYSIWRLKDVKEEIVSSFLYYYQPYFMGAMAAYVVSMFTLTRNEAVPTFLIAGLGLSYERLAREETSLEPLVLNSKLIKQMFMVSLGFIALLYTYIRFVYRMF